MNIIVITGHYGSGKTNLAVNLAVEASKSGRVTVADLDIVNPYFRTADFEQLFSRLGVELIAPQFANSNLDIPALNFDITSHIRSDSTDTLIIDVGGDDAGATVLGRFAQTLNGCQNLQMIYVINVYRYLTRTPDEALELMYDIEAAARMRHTGIVNNSNLGDETTEETVESGRTFASAIAQKAQLPLLYTTFPDCITCANARPVKVYVKKIWEK